MKWVVAWLVAVQLAFGMALATAYEADAGPLCEVRSAAHIAKYGGLAKDSAEHVARGELPTCDPAESSEASHASQSNDDRDGKSRYCKRRWFC
jgi:hypothetical protein